MINKFSNIVYVVKRGEKMRDALKDMFSKTVLFKYHLPTEDIKRQIYPLNMINALMFHLIKILVS